MSRIKTKKAVLAKKKKVSGKRSAVSGRGVAAAPVVLPTDDVREVVKKRPLWVRFLRRIRGYFLTGIVVAMPLVITLYLANWFINFVDNQVMPLFNRVAADEGYWLAGNVPGLGLVISVVLLILLGWFATNIFGQTLITLGERLLARMPVIRTVYNALKQIFEAVFSRRSTNFREVGIIEYPRPGVYALVFITTTIRGEILQAIKARSGEEVIGVFLPTTPNPTSGFLLFLPRRQVRRLSMSVENGIKMVISGGILEPNELKPSDPAPRPNRAARKLSRAGIAGNVMASKKMKQDL